MDFNILEKWEWALVASGLLWILSLVIILSLRWKTVVKARKRLLIIHRYSIFFLLTAIIQTSIVMALFFLDHYLSFFVSVFELVGTYIDSSEPNIIIISSSLLSLVLVLLADLASYNWKKRSILALLLTSLSSFAILFFAYTGLYSGYYYLSGSQQAMPYYIKTIDGFVLSKAPGKNKDLDSDYQRINQGVKEEISYFLTNNQHREVPKQPGWYSIDSEGGYTLYRLPGRDPNTGTYLQKLDESAMDKMILSTNNILHWDEERIFLAKKRSTEREDALKQAMAEKQRKLVKMLEKKKQYFIAENLRLEEEKRRKEEAIRLAIIKRNRALLLSGDMSLRWIDKNTEKLIIDSGWVVIKSWFRESEIVNIDYFSFYEGLLIVGIQIKSLKNHADLEQYFNLPAKAIFKLYDRHGGEHHPWSVITDSMKTKLRKGESQQMAFVFPSGSLSLENLKSGNFQVLSKDKDYFRIK